MEELNSAIKESSEAVDRQGSDVVDHYYSAKEFYTPANLLANGMRRISTHIPFDTIILRLVRRLIHRFSD